MEECLKDKWCNALRSDIFQKGKYIIFNKDTGTFCCLGVLNALLGGQALRTSVRAIEKTTETSIERSKDPLDPVVTGIPVDIQARLCAMNDSDEVNFRDIADWIESNL